MNIEEELTYREFMETHKFCNRCKYLDTSAMLMSNPPQYKCIKNDTFVTNIYTEEKECFCQKD